MATGGRKKKQLHDDGAKQPKEGKIGSGYMVTVNGQPELRDMVEVTSQTDRELQAKGKQH